MSGLPALPGALQATFTLSGALEVTVGAAGTAGGSFTSVSSMVTSMVAVPP